MTRRLFAPRSWKTARAALERDGRRILVALDLDGTIAPIAPRPELARVPAATLRALKRAARAESVKIVVLSARPLSDLKRLVPLRNVELVGQYGLEGPVAPAPGIVARFRRACARVTRALRPVVGGTRGAFLEPKSLTVAVHDRSVRAPSARRRLRAGIRGVTSGEARRSGFFPMPGRSVVDFVPRGWDKGRALRALRARHGPRTVFYFGDSDGDEPAFRTLGRGDFPVRVGRDATRARYRVLNQRGVARFLDAVTAHRAGPA